MKLRILSILMILLLLLSGCTTTSVYREYLTISKAELAEQAEVIVTGKFVRSGWAHREGDSIYKNYTFEVEQVLKGEPEETVKIRFEGGRFLFETVEADAPPHMNERCMVFLRRHSDGKRYVSWDELYYYEQEDAWGWGEEAVSNQGDLMENILAMTE